jgi:spermidine/putrescine transport system permease protein
VAVVLVLVNYLVPLAVLPIYASLQNVNEDEIEASRDLGAGAATTFWRVTLPLVRTGLFFSFAITVILAAGDYLTPQLVGGINGLMIGTVIADNFGATFNWALGAASSFVTTGCIVIILIVAYFGFRRVLR